MEAPEREKGRRRMGFVVVAALLGAAVYAASRLLRGRPPFGGTVETGDPAGRETPTTYVTVGDAGSTWPEEPPDAESAAEWLAGEAPAWLAEEADGRHDPGAAGPASAEAAAPVEAGDADAGPRLHDLKEIEGIGPFYADQLAALGLRTTYDLLHAGAGPGGREDLAVATGISGKLILRWVKQADLFRVKGVAGQYAELLEAAGVDTVPELARRRADSLCKKLAEVNDEKRLVRRLPTEEQVSGWIEAAKALPRVVEY